MTIFAAACLLYPAAMKAETIRLKAGGVIRGAIIDQNRTHIRVRDGKRIRSIRKSAIRAIDYGTAKRIAGNSRARRNRARRSAANNTSARSPRASAKVARSDLLDREVAVRARRDWNPYTSSFHPGHALRSAVLPGWGQFTSGRRTTGRLIGALFFTSALYVLNTRRIAVAARADYDERVAGSLLAAGPAFASGNLSPAVLNLALNEGAFPDYRGRVRAANSAALFTGLLYLGQVVHAFFLGPRETNGLLAASSRPAEARFRAVILREERDTRAVVGFETRFR